MGFLSLPKFNHFSGRFAWLVLRMDLKILLSPKILNGTQKNRHWETDAILRSPKLQQDFTAIKSRLDKEHEKIHSKVVRFKGSKQPQFACCTMGKPTLKGKFVLLQDPLQLFHWPLWVQVSPGAWFSWWSATRFQRAAPMGWKTLNLQINLESQVCCIYRVDFSNYSRTDDGGRFGKYVISPLGAVFEYICWRVLEFTSWNYAVEVFETSAASIHEKYHFPVQKLETSKHQPITNISVNEWSSSEVYQWSMTFQPKSFHFKSSTFEKNMRLSHACAQTAAFSMCSWHIWNGWKLPNPRYHHQIAVLAQIAIQGSNNANWTSGMAFLLESLVIFGGSESVDISTKRIETSCCWIKHHHKPLS